MPTFHGGVYPIVYRRDDQAYFHDDQAYFRDGSMVRGLHDLRSRLEEPGPLVAPEDSLGLGRPLPEIPEPSASWR